MHIPLVDLSKQYQSLKKEIDSAIYAVIEKTAFIGSNNFFVQKFEKEFAAYIGTKHCIGCANGTDAIEILLKAMGISYGDEVIVPANSWISTSEAVSNIGATPIFVDCLPDFYTIDFNKIERQISSRTKAIIPVHLYGLPAEMDPIIHIARKHNLFVLEDCAQAHGAKYKGKKIGTLGNCASFSFYPGKNLGAYGDAGAMVTNNEEIALNARMIANHGQIRKHEHKIEGRNSRLDGIQAAILSVKLPFLDQWNTARKNHAELYSGLLKNSKCITPKKNDYAEHIYHLYVIRVPDRNSRMERMKSLGIETAIHYPAPLPFLQAYKKYSYKESDFPVASSQKDKILSLPMYSELNAEIIKYVADALNQ